MSEGIPLLVDVWREASRHSEIGEAVTRIGQRLAREIPLDLLLVRRIDVLRRCVETIAAARIGSLSVPEQSCTDLSEAMLSETTRWLNERRVLRCTILRSDSARPPWVPADLEGSLLACALTVEGAPAGILLLNAAPSNSFTVEHEAMTQALIDPFSVALENSHRLRELLTSREAAEAEKLTLLNRLGRPSVNPPIVGSDKGLRGVMERVDLVARSDVPVLILGETGSGKEVISRAIHDRSARASGPFLRVNCGAITPELIDSELFGHERGSFTGAIGTRKGWFERADGGTLLLDEIGELPLAAQVRLLRILQDGSFERVGGERQLHVDVRVIAATHRDLQSMIAEGLFREDLWYRVAIFPILLPPLRDRIEDIPALAEHFALRASRHFGTRLLAPSPEELRLLVSYAWPGNVRELAAVIDRAAILGDGKRLEVAKALGLIPPPIRARHTGSALIPPRVEERGHDGFLTLDHAMARYIESVLASTAGRIEGPHGAARVLGINPHTLRARMRKLKVDWRRFRPSVADAEPSVDTPMVSVITD